MMMNDWHQIRWLLLPASVVNGLRQAASEPFTLWDYIANGAFITIAFVLWVALRR